MGEKNFNCDFCDTRFTTAFGAREHERTFHVNEKAESRKPYKCDICSEAFTQKNSLKKHCDRKHQERKHYDCPICKTSFTSKRGLNFHSKSFHALVSR